MNKFLIILTTVLVWQCAQKTEVRTEAIHSISKDFKEIEDSYQVYVIGDWGRNGQNGQKELADLMNLAAEKVEPEFIASTGDNFYHNGIASTDDPYWISSYENVYDGANLFCDWYVTLGNHDYRGNVQAQIDYSNVSRRWNMPDRYFFKDVIADDHTTARFVFIDTSPLNDDYYNEQKYQQVTTQDTTAQLQWIDSVLNVEVDWKIVIGHHPLYTGGKRKDEENFVRNHVEPLLEKHNVSLYFAGHEHDLQHIKPSQKKTHHVISGAGSDIRPTGELNGTVFAKAVNGFVSSAITRDSIYSQFVDVQGNVIHQFSVKK